MSVLSLPSVSIRNFLDIVWQTEHTRKRRRASLILAWKSKVKDREWIILPSLGMVTIMQGFREKTAAQICHAMFCFKFCVSLLLGYPFEAQDKDLRPFFAPASYRRFSQIFQVQQFRDDNLSSSFCLVSFYGLYMALYNMIICFSNYRRKSWASGNQTKDLSNTDKACNTVSILINQNLSI
jgi:hypothetical protein